MQSAGVPVSDSAPVFDPELIRRYDVAGPRYTSYPTAPQFHDGFDAAAYRREIATLDAADRAQPLSLYVHIPFCATVCHYCACNRIITANRRHAAPYLDLLLREIEVQGALFGRERTVDQLAWGGGTPTFLDADARHTLMAALRRHFRLREDDAGEYAIEIDPRGVTRADVAQLRLLGFNRMSIGVQDFDPRVQAAVNRIQSPECTEAAVARARACGFHSVNVDLIYGLPHQSVASFERTLARVLDFEPDRLAVFNYAHLPARFRTQRQIDEKALPDAAEKLAILQMSVERLTASGYVYIGMDHFARPDDALAQALRAGTLTRNFQGYTTHGNCDLVGLGMSAIGRVGASYAQNARDLAGYAAAVHAHGLAIERGVRLDDDDHLRRELILALLCQGEVDLNALGHRHGVDCAAYFAAELESLEQMQQDGLVARSADRMTVLPRGRLLARNIAMQFDRHLQGAHATPTYSRAL